MSTLKGGEPMARRIASSLVICCVLAAFAMPSFAGGRFLEPRRFDPATDGDLVQVTVDGRTISAWTYRNGSETDIAIQSLDKASGQSGELVLIGRDDRIDQTRPALTVDANGSLRARLNVLQERFTCLVGLNRGATLRFRSAASIESALEARGLETTRRASWKGTPLANVLIEARKQH